MARILLVDDSSTIRKLLSRIIAPAGHEVLEAGDGLEALEMLRNEAADLVVADLNMPRMDGLELIKTLRGDPVYAEIPIVMLTTEADDENKRKGIAAGANVYLIKPAPPHVILFKIHSLLGMAPPNLK